MQLIPLIEKELLENKIMFFAVPFITTLMIIIMLVVSAFSMEVHTGNSTLFLDIRYLEDMDASARQWYLNSLFNDTTLLLRIIFVLIAIHYASNTFYSARRDGSELFWRSLPINPWLETAAKLITILAIIPLVFFGFIVIVQLANLALVSYLGSDHGISLLEHVWLPAQLHKVWLYGLGYIIVDFFWLAPMLCWFMLWSTLAKRAPFIISLIPLVLIAVGEQFLFSSAHLAKGVIMHSVPNELLAWITNLPKRMLPSELIDFVAKATNIPLLNSTDFMERILSKSFWFGILITIPIFIATVKIHDKSSNHD